MATAIDENFSGARWQAQDPKLLEPTIVIVIFIHVPLVPLHVCRGRCVNDKESIKLTVIAVGLNKQDHE